MHLLSVSHCVLLVSVHLHCYMQSCTHACTMEQFNFFCLQHNAIAQSSSSYPRVTKSVFPTIDTLRRFRTCFTLYTTWRALQHLFFTTGYITLRIAMQLLLPLLLFCPSYSSVKSYTRVCSTRMCNAYEQHANAMRSAHRASRNNSNLAMYFLVRQLYNDLH